MVMESLARRGEEVDLMDLQEQAHNSLEEEREKALIEAIKKANQAKDLEQQKQAQFETEQRVLKDRLRDYASQKHEETGKPLNEIHAVIRPKPKIKTLYHCVSGEVVGVKVDDETLKALGVNEFQPMFRTDIYPPTSSQIELLHKFSIPEDLIAYKGQAADIITNLLSRKARGLGTYKQVKLLINRKIPNAEFYTENECKAIIQSLVNHGWRSNTQTQSIISRCTEAMER